MSALRIPGPDGRIQLVVIDDGAVGRVSFTRYGARQTIPGSFIVAESERARKTRVQREAMARLRSGRNEAER